MFIYFRFSLPSYFQSPVMGKTANSETRLIVTKRERPTGGFVQGLSLLTDKRFCLMLYVFEGCSERTVFRSIEISIKLAVL